MAGDTGNGRALVVGLQILLPPLKAQTGGESATECVCKQVCVCMHARLWALCGVKADGGSQFFPFSTWILGTEHHV